MSKKFSHTRHIATNGLTLVELLIGLVIISIVMIAGVSLVLSSLRTASRVETFLRLQSKWSLFQYLLNNEIQESIAASTGTGAISLSIPYGDPPSCTTLVSYSLSASTISRSGPSVNANGSLAIPSSSTCTSVTATTETLLTSVTTFTTSIDTSSSQRVSYSLSFTDPTGVSFGNKGTSSMGSARIIN